MVGVGCWWAGELFLLLFLSSFCLEATLNFYIDLNPMVQLPSNVLVCIQTICMVDWLSSL